MKRSLIFIKDFLLWLPVSRVLRPVEGFFHYLYYFNRLSLWIQRHKSELSYSDFHTFSRNYDNRLNLYGHILSKFGLSDKPVVYLEFGVASGASFKWFVEKIRHEDAVFYGFDTFEGLPEDWGYFFQKGSMAFSIPEVSDNRAKFFKGLFQETLGGFIKAHEAELLRDSPKIIHLDADLYSATAFVLSQLYPYLKKGDLIIFDEFSVALHEFKAFDEFVQTFYIQLKPVAAVNNFLQTVFVVG